MKIIHFNLQVLFKVFINHLLTVGIHTLKNELWIKDIG